MRSYISFLSNRYLWARKGEAFITIITLISIIGVALGVAVINVVMAVMTGFESDFRERVFGGNAHITIRDLSGSLSNWEDLLERINKDQTEIISALPFTQNQALLSFANRTAGVVVRGITKAEAAFGEQKKLFKNGEDLQLLFEDSKQLEKREDPLTEGKAEALSDYLDPIAIGGELARSLGVQPGDVVTIVSPQIISSPFGASPRLKRFRVAKIFSLAFSDLESAVVYLSLDQAQRFFRLGDKVSGIDIRITNPMDSGAIARSLYAKYLHNYPKFYLQDWAENNRPLWEAIKLEKRVYFIVLLLIIVMASFSIITTLIMIVLEKRRDIALLKSFGATDLGVALVFVRLGTIIGLVGTLTGVLLGVVGCFALREYGFPLDERVFMISTVPVRLEAVNFIGSALAAFLICVLATIYPSLRAARIAPSEGLRY
ncbi:MAG TPA: ABC transporter permease [Oligoflexia bacterium]|nr:ABC transporter permease [Oligoflexia bacterium]HMP27122.1 ABC transporter permease [Oligoflexia bacterium]